MSKGLTCPCCGARIIFRAEKGNSTACVMWFVLFVVVRLNALSFALTHLISIKLFLF